MTRAVVALLAVASSGCWTLRATLAESELRRLREERAARESDDRHCRELCPAHPEAPNCRARCPGLTEAARRARAARCP